MKEVFVSPDQCAADDCRDRVPLALRVGPNPLFRAPGFVQNLAGLRRPAVQTRRLENDGSVPLSGLVAIRWSTNLSSKVNMPHIINFEAKCGAHLVT